MASQPNTVVNNTDSEDQSRPKLEVSHQESNSRILHTIVASIILVLKCILVKAFNRKHKSDFDGMFSLMLKNLFVASRSDKKLPQGIREQVVEQGFMIAVRLFGKSAASMILYDIREVAENAKILDYANIMCKKPEAFLGDINSAKRLQDSVNNLNRSCNNLYVLMFGLWVKEMNNRRKSRADQKLVDEKKLQAAFKK